MKVDRIRHKIVHMLLCICVILLFIQAYPSVHIKISATQKENTSQTSGRNDDIGIMSLDQLLGLAPKKINEFIEQHVDEELEINEITSYYECRPLLEYLEMLQKVIFQMFIGLVMLISIQRCRQRLLRYRYNKDGPRRKVPIVMSI